MNGYKLIADSYIKLKEEGKIEPSVADKKIRILEFLSTCDMEDICELFDSSAFNDIFKGYLNEIIIDAELDSKAKARLKESARYVLDTKSAIDVINS